MYVSMSRCHDGAHALGYPAMVGWKRKIPVVLLFGALDTAS